ncbi:hypothetical protein D8674_028821 [Pyrus ussuriensis x Pyrus communis]|uniref:Reverse transcriptase domain-containing protein n=1 Tax=Pyrus ussuriensis x Pyrus communis TaxID=2448454 RepID=A0A5N5IAV7_9ROSA|nr:hypothetical protein D8674_028821 [Pyrus ussuriensis x Pyrus communis]
MLWEDHEFAQRSSRLGGTSNPRFTEVNYESLRRKLKKQKEFMTLPKRGQLLSAGFWVGEWCKSLIWCIFRVCINNQSYWLNHWVKRRRKQIGRLPRKRDQTTKIGEKMVIKVEELAMQLESGLELSNMELGVKLIAKGVRNILKSAWKEFGEIQINWVQDNLYMVEDLNKAKGFLRLRIMGISPQNPSGRTNDGRQQRSANEGSNSRAQRSLKKIRRQLTQGGDDIGVIGEENRLEVLVQVENTWPYLEDIVENETTKRGQRLAHNDGSLEDINPVVFLSETKMKNHRITGVRRRMGFVNGWDVPPVKFAGGLSLWWDNCIKVNMISVTRTLIHTKMWLTKEEEWFHTSWDWGDILNCLDSVVTEAMNATLCSPISNLEIKEAVFNIGGSKVPGPNGFQGIFFHSFWDIIVAEIHGIVVECLVGDGCPSQINFTNIALIPKLRKTKTKFEMGIKLDMNKAYDRVEWDFLEAIMEHLGFHRRWINMVICCVKTMEASGQQINCQKSVVYFGANIPALLATELCNILDMPKVEDPGKYLGIPTIWGRLKRMVVQYIKDRVIEKISGWKRRFLSQVGNEVLIKAMV